ncbi:MAG: hypothetical protein QM582_09060 [Micropruina sp.]|uniref:hypothetical protein n=1 Tax=Micropruina sp. TaxID=2737536 RepID=UPI0039E368FC
MTEDSLLELLEAGDFDYVSVDEVGSLAVVPGLKRWSKKAALVAMKELFGAGYMEPGDLLEPGFVTWPGSAEEWMARARAELSRLPWMPQGAGFWMKLTERGAERLVELKGSIRADDRVWGVSNHFRVVVDDGSTRENQ